MRFRLLQASELKDHILAGLFLFISFALLITHHEGGLDTIRTTSITVLSYMEQPLSHVRVYRTALQTNQELHEQNIRLQDELSRLRSVEQENRELRRLLDFEQETEHDLKPVRVISKNLTGINNSITVNAGSSDGINVGMPLVNADGLIGRVVLTSNDYSLIMPFTNPLFRVSAQLQETRDHGIVSWHTERHNELIMEYVPQTVEVDTGSVVETSGHGNQFPPNIPIGEVTRVESMTGRDTHRIHVRPFASLHRLAEAYINRYEPVEQVDRLLMEYEEQF